jgi:hypothetical protein
MANWGVALEYSLKHSISMAKSNRDQNPLWQYAMVDCGIGTMNITAWADKLA